MDITPHTASRQRPTSEGRYYVLCISIIVLLKFKILLKIIQFVAMAIVIIYYIIIIIDYCSLAFVLINSNSNSNSNSNNNI